MNITYYAACSLDGFIAKPDGDVSWLDELGIPMAETGYEAFYAGVDGLVMGRGTYDVLSGLGPWPYDDKPAWVCSHRHVPALPKANLQAARTPEGVAASARAMGLGHLWLVGGGSLAAAFLAHGLLTRIIVVQMPVVLGTGVPLFGPLENHVVVRQDECRTMPRGFTQLEYRVRPRRDNEDANETIHP